MTASPTTDVGLARRVDHPAPPARRDGRPHRIGLLSVHTSPLQQPGTGDGGGLNVYVREVARRLVAGGHDVEVLTRRTSVDQPEEVDLDGVRVVHLPGGPPRPLAKHDVPSHLCGFTMRALGRGDRYDLLHSHYWLSGWVARRLSRRWDIPYVHTFHTLGMMKNNALAPGDRPEPPLRLVAERRIAADAARVLPLTCGEGRLLHTTFGLSGGRMDIVPAGVDVDVFHPHASDPVAEAAAAAAVSGDGPLVLFVGRLQPLKGPDVAVESLARLRRRVPDARLAIVGGTSGNGTGRTEPADLQALAAELGVADAVTILPARPQPQLAALYRAADVVVVPSRSETFGLVALEAQATATPVVAADVDGLQYVVREGGQLVSGNDPADYAAAIARYLQDPELARRTGQAGRRAALRSSWDATVARLEAVYGEVAAPGAALASSA